MTARQQRMVFVGLIVLGVGAAVTFALVAFKENIAYYVKPSELLADPKAAEKSFRMGGMVKQGSVERTSGSLTVRFIATDFEREIPVTYTGVLPDLFREGQGVVVRGKMVDGVFQAEEVNAKHDEKYMPPGVADKMKAQNGGQMPMAKPQS
jgi:cytochrome c-type biogenesis protein CcmE